MADKEKCAKNTLIGMGANPVDVEGNPINTDDYKIEEGLWSVVAEEPAPYGNVEDETGTSKSAQLSLPL